MITTAIKIACIIGGLAAAYTFIRLSKKEVEQQIENYKKLDKLQLIVVNTQKTRPTNLKDLEDYN